MNRRATAAAHLLAGCFLVYSACAERDSWEGHIVALLLILAVIAPLMAALMTILRIPLGLSRSTRSVPSVIVGSSSGFLLFGAGCYFMPVATFPLLGFGLTLGLPVTAALLLWRTGESYSPAGFLTSILAAFAYSCGLIYLLNGVLTPTPPARIVSTVVSKQTGIGGYPNYFLRLSSVDPRVGDGQWRVSKRSFFALRAGARACVDLYQGGLGATWDRAGPCPVTSSEEIPWVGFSSWGSIKVEFWTNAELRVCRLPRMLWMPDVAPFVHACRYLHRHRWMGFQCRDGRVGEVASLRAARHIVS